MKRFTLILAATTISLALWVHFAFFTEHSGLRGKGIQSWLLLLAPLEVLVLFGFYSVAVIIKRLAFFPECPAAAQSLQEEMKRARADLTKQGFKFNESKKEK